MRSIRSFDEFVNEKHNDVVFSVDGQKEDELLNARFGRRLDFKEVDGDEYYVLSATDFHSYMDLVNGTDGADPDKVKEYDDVDEGVSPYFSSYTAALDAAREKATSQGYTIPEDEWWKVSSGPRKPDQGKTNTFTLALEKDGKPSKHTLSIQVYGMGSKYELNCYVA